MTRVGVATAVSRGAERSASVDAPPRPRWATKPLGYALLALLAYVPPLLTAAGRVAADTKSYLYIDPDRLLGRAPSMWDPNIGMGTVTHQNIGYLFPMGPFYWFFEHIGVPDWVAQRIWLGTLVFAAATGVLYLCRTLGERGPGVVVAALAFAFSPYSLHYAARISVILLPWAALGWMLALTVKAARDGGWRYPAIFAIVVQIVGGVNATALIFAGVAPVAWLAYATLASREVPWRRALSTATKIGLLTVVASAWWIAGLSLQGGYGLNILKYTETVEAVARTSMPNEVLRGLGYWFFYGQDAIGPWIESAANYTQEVEIIVLGYGLVCLALLSAAVVRWRHRAFFVLLTLVGVIIAVGAHPFDSPTPLGAVFKSFATGSTAGLALRSTGRAIPLVTLSLAMLLGAGVNATAASLARLRRPGLGVAAAVVVAALVLLNFPALHDGTYYGKNLQRDEELPSYWKEAAAHLDAQPYDSRVLELPGADFAAYRWGNTVDPVTPGMIDRPYIARELIPYGGPATADLLNAFDRRLQEGVFDPMGFAAVLRRMAVGDVVLRNDIQYERYDLIRPRALARAFDPSPPGFGEPTAFGDQLVDSPEIPVDDELSLAPGQPREQPPVVEVHPLDDPWPIVRAESGDRPLVLAGSGEGFVDAADVGLLDGSGVVLYSASYGDDAEALREAIGDDGVLVVTDSNRRRALRWSTVRDNAGYTEQAGEEPLTYIPSDARLDVFPEQTEASRTVTEQRGVRVVAATEYGNPVAYTPEDRAARAFDGDVRTAWRTSAFDEVIGQRLRLELEESITTDRLNLVQVMVGPVDRFLTEVRLRFDDDAAHDVVLGATSRTPEGQDVFFGRRTFRTLEIEVRNNNFGPRLMHRGASAPGFAEIRLADESGEPVRVDEVVRMPSDLLDATGDASLDHPLMLLMSRMRGLAVPPRYDEELQVDRSFELPTPRSFSFTGSVRIAPEATSGVIDAAMGMPSAGDGGVSVSGDEFLSGCVRCRQTAAIDGDPTSAWTTPMSSVRDRRARFELSEPIAFDRMALRVVADGRHSVPTRLRIATEEASREIVVPAITDLSDENATVEVPLRFQELRGREVEVSIIDVREVRGRNRNIATPTPLPVAIAELGIDGLERPAVPGRIDTGCRNDLVTIDGEPVGVRITGDRETAEQLGALTFETCTPDDRASTNGATPVRLGAGEHVLRTQPGRSTGLQFDRLLLASAAGGDPLEATGGRVTGFPDEPPEAPTLEVVSEGRTRMQVRVEGASEPFWLVLAQSRNDGWTAKVRGGDSLGGSQLVDGFANGWVVDPAGNEELVVDLEWTPQRRVWAGLAISIVAVLGCAVVVAVTWKRRRRDLETDEGPRLASPLRSPGRTPRWAFAAGPLAAGFAGAVVVAPWVGIVVGVLVLVVLARPGARWLLSLTPPLILAAAGLYIALKQFSNQFPPVFEWPTLFPRARTLGWLAVVLLAADALVELLRDREAEQTDGS